MPPPATTFVAVAFASVTAAEDAMTAVRELDLRTRDAAVVVRTEAGRIELEQAHEVAAGDTLVGVGTAGLVAGLLFGVPVVGALVGLGGGRVGGARHGLPDSRMRKLGEDLQPGQAVLCVLVDPELRAPRARACSAATGSLTGGRALIGLRAIARAETAGRRLRPRGTAARTRPAGRPASRRGHAGR